MAIDGTIGAWGWAGPQGSIATSVSGGTGVLSWLSSPGNVQAGPVTQAQINPPPNVPVDAVDARGVPVAVQNGWATFFSASYNILFALTQSGTTAQRPTKLLWAGRTYFDTTLGLPIWYRFTGWVNSSGNAV